MWVGVEHSLTPNPLPPSSSRLIAAPAAAFFILLRDSSVEC